MTTKKKVENRISVGDEKRYRYAAVLQKIISLAFKARFSTFEITFSIPAQPNKKIRLVQQ